MNCIGATGHRQKSGRKPLSARLRGERGVPAWLRREDEVGSSAVRDGAPPPHPDPLRPQGQLIPRIRALVAKDDAASVKIRANRLGSGEVRRSVAAELSDGSVSNKSKPTRCPRCDGKPDIAGPEREGQRSTRSRGSARVVAQCSSGSFPACACPTPPSLSAVPPPNSPSPASAVGGPLSSSLSDLTRAAGVESGHRYTPW